MLQQIQYTLRYRKSQNILCIVKAPQYTYPDWFLFYYLFQTWSVIALRCCVSFCCTQVNQLYTYIHTHTHTYIHPHPLEPASTSFIPCFQVVISHTEHRAEFPVLCSGFPPAICFTHGSVLVVHQQCTILIPSECACSMSSHLL